jgi:hypothetical protein
MEEVPLFLGKACIPLNYGIGGRHVGGFAPLRCEVKGKGFNVAW